jgi:serine protease AprX
MTRPRRHRLAGAALAVVATAAATVSPGHASAPRPTGAVDPALVGLRGTVGVVVQAEPGRTATVRRAVARLGGRVTTSLPIVSGLAARLPANAVHALAASPGTRVVSLDRKMHVQATSSSEPPASVYRRVVRADRLNAAGAGGRGVTVALVDTGVTPMPDLAGRLVPVASDPRGLATARCMNFSAEPGCEDSYGHGTFIAGLIAGDGSASRRRYVGAAPAANVLSVKIAGRDGSADVSKVLAAIQWVVSYSDRYNVRVLNLSLGTDSRQSYRLDPLNYAVEKAWRSGITVVVAASNRGPAAGTISKPGDDPLVVTVGAIDDLGTVGVDDDVLPDFSSRGPTAADGLAKPDVVAPGAHVVSLAAPGSAISAQFPSSMPAPYRRGSGTSMATGIVSGVVAAMLSAAPAMTPDRVKYALTSTARDAASTDPLAVGAGVVDGYAATYSAGPGVANDGVTPARGGGLLDDSRGSVEVGVTASVETQVLSGEITAQLRLFDRVELVDVPWNELTWPLSQWAGNCWYGNSWYGNSWYGNSWYGNSWYGEPQGNSWYGNSWYGGAWYGAWDR